jgi:uncharacterized membrane protein
MPKFWELSQIFGIFYIVTKIWQQTKCSHFLATSPKFAKVGP